MCDSQCYFSSTIRLVIVVFIQFCSSEFLLRSCFCFILVNEPSFCFVLPILLIQYSNIADNNVSDMATVCCTNCYFSCNSYYIAGVDNLQSVNSNSRPVMNISLKIVSCITF